jgi:RNA polymerase sigma-70 factor (ECF subfamily)
MVYNGQAMTFQDTSLVGAAQEGSRWAFEQLFRAHEKRIYSLALHMVGDPSIAEDLTQDTFVRAWENLGRLRHEQAFGGWLRRIALNLIWDHIRTRKPEDELDDEAAERLPEGGRTAHEELERQRMARKVQAAVMSLPEHQRVVLAMFYWEDLPVNDIAATLSIARGTVISRLARGRDTLRRKLGPAVSEPPGVS